MQSIQDIIDKEETTLGFNYFYGLGQDDQGFLRRMLHTNPSLEALYAQLKDDINFIEDDDIINYFNKETHLNAFKGLKKYLNDAKKYVREQLKKKRKKLKNDGKEMKNEYESLRKELQDPYISEKEREQIEWEIKTLFTPVPDNLDEVKSKFEAIDHKVKQELKKIGFEEEEEKEEDENYILPEDEDFSEEPFESKESDLDKIVDEGNRRYSMREFNELYENMVTVKEADDAQKVVQNQKLVAQYGPKNDAERIRKNNENLAFLRKVGIQVKNPKDIDTNQKLVDGYVGATQKK